MYEIILFQGLFLVVLVFVLGIDFWLEVLFLFCLIIVCILIGVIFGDIQIGLIIGGLIELVFVGLIFVGGVQLFNLIMVGLMIIVIVWFTGVDVKIVIGFGLLFSLLMQYVILFFYFVFLLFMIKVDKCVKEVDTVVFFRFNWIMMFIVVLVYVVIVFFCIYLVQGVMQVLVKVMFVWLIYGFEVVGGILFVVGFGLLLCVMFKV